MKTYRVPITFKTSKRNRRWISREARRIKQTASEWIHRQIERLWELSQEPKDKSQ